LDVKLGAADARATHKERRKLLDEDIILGLRSQQRTNNPPEIYTYLPILALEPINS
jgi:hypothetical protein